MLGYSSDFRQNINFTVKDETKVDESNNSRQSLKYDLAYWLALSQSFLFNYSDTTNSTNTHNKSSKDLSNVIISLTEGRGQVTLPSLKL